MNRGQILPDSVFGCVLVALAAKSQFIVEIGTLTGEGSTACLHKGMTDPDQRLVGIEACRESAAIAQERYKHDHRVQILYGSVVSPEAFPAFTHHPYPDGKGWWECEKAMVTAAPHITEDYFGRIDLLLIDGGEFGAYEEFMALGHKTQMIALDDSQTFKNSRTRQHILQLNNWEVLRDETDRNGWFVARRTR